MNNQEMQLIKTLSNGEKVLYELLSEKFDKFGGKIMHFEKIISERKSLDKLIGLTEHWDLKFDELRRCIAEISALSPRLRNKNFGIYPFRMEVVPKCRADSATNPTYESLSDEDYKL
jgi:hypothetical protein